MATYDSTGLIDSVINELVSTAQKAVPIKTVVDIEGTKEKINSSQLPAAIHLISGFSQTPTSGGRNGSHSITISFKVLLIVEERIQKKVGKNLKNTIVVLDAYLAALRGEESGLTLISVKPIARSGGPIGVVSYAGIDYNGTIVDMDVTIFPN